MSSKISPWDSVTINDSWRNQKDDLWTTRQGHTRAATGNSKACHGTAIPRNGPNTPMERNSLGHLLRESPSRKRSSGCKSTQCTSHTRDTDTNKFSKCTLTSRSTHTHMLDGGDFNAQFGANEEPDAIDSKCEGGHIRHATQQRTVSQTLGSPAPVGAGQHVLKKQDNSKATYHTTKHCKQLDYEFTNRVLFKHCKDAEATRQIDMNSDDKAVIPEATNGLQDSKDPTSNEKDSKDAEQKRRQQTLE